MMSNMYEFDTATIKLEVWPVLSLSADCNQICVNCSHVFSC